MLVKTSSIFPQSMRAHCETKSSGELAVWDIAGTSEDDNGTMFLCQVPFLEDRIGYLYVFGRLMPFERMSLLERKQQKV